jgi:predicted Rossmann fold flavoprotein
MTDTDIIIIGAGAAGLMAAAVAGRRGRRVTVLDHGKKTAEKIRISGGGRCNFTNIHAKPDNFLSRNPHFCRSALSRYTPADFVALVDRHGIKWHEKKLGQLFCDESAQQIIDMLLAECADAGVSIRMDTRVDAVRAAGKGYAVQTQGGDYECESLVIASGGLSIPKIGATRFGYDIARQFGLDIVPTRAGLVPLTFTDDIAQLCRDMTGLSVEARVKFEKTAFAEGLLFTHRGLSGPSILQISSYWREGEALAVDLADGVDVLAALKTQKKDSPKQEIHNALGAVIPKRLAQALCAQAAVDGRLADCPDKKLAALAAAVKEWRVRPNGSEGYRTAEVTLGGVDTAHLSSQTMAVKTQPGLYFIGEVVDVTGHLGGFNFQWAWASGHAAGLAA